MASRVIHEMTLLQRNFRQEVAMKCNQLEEVIKIEENTLKGIGRGIALVIQMLIA